MSILENFYPGTGQYNGVTVFFYSGKRTKKYTIGDLHPTTLRGTEVGKEPLSWWNEAWDVGNVENIRTFLGMITSENELIKLYTAKDNKNTQNRLRRLIELNSDLVDFFLTYVNKLYWLKIGAAGPEEKSGLTILQCQDLVLPAVQHLSKVVSAIMEAELPHKIVANLLTTEFEKDAMEFKMNTGNLKDTVNLTNKKNKQKKH